MFKFVGISVKKKKKNCITSAGHTCWTRALERVRIEYAAHSLDVLISKLFYTEVLKQIQKCTNLYFQDIFTVHQKISFSRVLIFCMYCAYDCSLILISLRQKNFKILNMMQIFCLSNCFQYQQLKILITNKLMNTKIARYVVMLNPQVRSQHCKRSIKLISDDPNTVNDL